MMILLRKMKLKQAGIDMKKLYITIIAFFFVASIPTLINAQQRFEISAGISTPGFHTWEKYGEPEFGEVFYYPHEYEYHSLSNMESHAYKSNYYPGLSIQAAYKLPDHGFTKRLSAVAYFGLHTVGFERIDYLTNKSLCNENAHKLDILVGARYHLVTKERFMMYAQFLVGGHIDDNSLYWKYNEYFNSRKVLTATVTFLGLRFQSPNGFCYMAELGEGSEYSLCGLVLIPGVRLGLGYTF